MTDVKTKKPWTPPQLRRLEPTDVIINLFTKTAQHEFAIPSKRAE